MEENKGRIGKAASMTGNIVGPSDFLLGEIRGRKYGHVARITSTFPLIKVALPLSIWTPFILISIWLEVQGANRSSDTYEGQMCVAEHVLQTPDEANCRLFRTSTYSSIKEVP